MEYSSEDTDSSTDFESDKNFIKKRAAATKKILFENTDKQSTSKVTIQSGLAENKLHETEDTSIKIIGETSELASNVTIKTIHVTAEGKDNFTIEMKEQKKRKIFEIKPKIARKRCRDPQGSKRKKSAVCRERGEEYISQKTGKIMPKKEINRNIILCKEKCRLKCGSKLSIEARESILRKFYKLDNNSKNCLLFKSIEIKSVARHRTHITRPKQHSFRFSVTFDKQKIYVCKEAFFSIYQVGKKKIENIQKQLKTGQPAPSPCKQGQHKVRPHKIADDVIANVLQHISGYPAESSHYSRNKNDLKKYLSPLLNVTKMHQMYIDECKDKKLEDKFLIKLSMYRHLFETNFNLSFGYPKSDTCSVCDAGGYTAEHKENYTRAFEMQKADRQKPLENKTICYISMDLQQTMPLPKLSTSKAFYLRQMWFYNFGIHCITYTGEKSYFFTWTEDVANRGSNEIASCLFRFCKLLKEDFPEINHLIVWSDSCAGQNKNFVIIGLYEYLVINGFFQTIDHKFPEVGHSYLDSDRDFGRIEKVMRKHQSIFIPDQYRDIIKSASTKNSICVNMENFFYNFEELPGKLYLFRKQANTLNQKINLRDNVKWIRVSDFGYYFYKPCLLEYTPFLEVDLKKKYAENFDRTGCVPTRQTRKTGGLTTEKLQNLKEQVKFIPEEYRWFYEGIIQDNMENPKKKRKTC